MTPKNIERNSPSDMDESGNALGMAIDSLHVARKFPKHDDDDDSFNDDESFASFDFSEDTACTSDSISDGCSEEGPSPASKAHPTKRRVHFNIPKCRSAMKIFRYNNPEGIPGKVWWTKAELTRTRQDCANLVRHIQRHELSYEVSLDILGRSFEKLVTEENVLECLQELADLSAARGLERHIASNLVAMCDEHEAAVLDAQDRFDLMGIMNKPQGQSLLSSIAQSSSKRARQLALKLAEYDVHEAYRAVLGPWVGEGSPVQQDEDDEDETMFDDDNEEF